MKPIKFVFLDWWLTTAQSQKFEKNHIWAEIKPSWRWRHRSSDGNSFTRLVTSSAVRWQQFRSVGSSFYGSSSCFGFVKKVLSMEWSSTKGLRFHLSLLSSWSFLVSRLREFGVWFCIMSGKQKHQGFISLIEAIIFKMFGTGARFYLNSEYICHEHKQDNWGGIAQWIVFSLRIQRPQVWFSVLRSQDLSSTA